MSRIHGQDSTEKLVSYDPGMSVAPLVYDKGRRYAVMVVDMLYGFVWYLTDVLPTKKIVKLF